MKKLDIVETLITGVPVYREIKQETPEPDLRDVKYVEGVGLVRINKTV